jgi:Solute carrier family 12
VDNTLRASSRGVALRHHLARIRLQALPTALPLRISDIHPSSIDRFNALYPGLLTADNDASDEGLQGGGDVERGESSGRIGMADEGFPRSPFHGRDIPDEHREALRLETLRVIRMGELIRKHSRDATMVVLGFVYHWRLPPGLLMCWAETLSYGLPPAILVRGNGDLVITGDV